MAALGELEHSPRAVDVDCRAVLKPKLEGHRRRAVHDLAHLLGERGRVCGRGRDRARDVAAHRDHALRIGVVGAEQRDQRALHPGRGLAVVRAAHERVHATVGALQIARQQLHADEAGRAGQQHSVLHGATVSRRP